MILRAVTAQVPPPIEVADGPARPITAWQICAALTPSGPWRPVNAGEIDPINPPVDVTMPGQFGDNETWVRVTFAGDRGSHDGLIQRPPARLGAAGHPTTIGAAAPPAGPGRIVR